MDHKCIYCGVTEDLSDSDIIPDALTNARIFNRNVCRVEHNNKFSDLFESKVISSLAFITNELDIKSSNGKRYASYDATVTIDGKAYKASLQGDKDILDGRVLTSVDNTHKLSSYEKMVEIAKDENLVQPIDVNKIKIEKKIDIHTGIFFDTAMFRMISKIAYEWYCVKNNVTDSHTEFVNIVSYITTGTGECPVSIIQTEELYNCFSKQFNLGSHVLLAFESKTGEINVIVTLFGILMYRVIISKTRPDFCTNNFLFMELCTDSTRKEIKHESIEAAETYFHKCLAPEKFIVGANINGVKILIPQNIGNTIDVRMYTFIFNMVKCFDSISKDTTAPNETINKILFKQLQQITQESLLHKKSITRFVNTYFSKGHEPIKLNPNQINKKVTMLFYAVFIVGTSGVDKLNDKIFQRLIREKLAINEGEELIVTNELEIRLRNEMLKNQDYSEALERGAKIIKNWR